MADEIWGLDRGNFYTKVLGDYLKAFEALGYAAGRLPQEVLADRLAGRLPAVVLDINFSGRIARVLGEVGIAYVSHVWDVWIQSVHTPPRMEEYLPRGRDYAFTFDPRQVETFRRVGVAHAEYLPACTDLETFRTLQLSPEERLRWGDRVSFCATPFSDTD